MTNVVSPPVPQAFKSPLRSIPLHFAAACFTGALLTDIAYWQTMQMMWTNFSAWLLLAGVVLGAVGFAAGAIDAARGLLALRTAAGRVYVVGGLLVLVAAIFNSLVHSRDAWTSVMPLGLALSIVTVALALIVAALGARVQRLTAGGW
ncbi:hypothetical protein ASE04_18865 [Rhizobium sp. Root708]|uniref:DUF2231 domain-containing protein n=1 Tax=Rhizobium sp. Root708 TaxID=1736592 RepID=UPI0006F7E2CD|nr:DUF2231 domain-containing protein [Rhizobium sp. Root708]KRB49232.1 hypothetical protein ASE04_18865 [Rhizobium sp. Root708]